VISFPGTAKYLDLEMVELGRWLLCGIVETPSSCHVQQPTRKGTIHNLKTCKSANEMRRSIIRMI
jgi:hypothetical protein